MKRSIVCGIILFTTLQCADIQKGNQPDALPLDHNGIQMKIGDSWLYRQTFIFKGLIDTSVLPDTIVGYSYFQANRDTTVNSKDYIIIEGKDYEVGKDSIQIFIKKFGINFTDSVVSMYDFSAGMIGGFQSGVLKSTERPIHLTQNTIGTLTLKKSMFAALNFNINFLTPVNYPLIKDSIYVYNNSINPKVRRKFNGIERIQVPAGLFDAYKFEWLTKEFLPDASILICDWIGEKGLIKRYSERLNNILSDSLGAPVDTFDSYTIYELIEKNDINRDTLIPWGKR